MFFHKLTPLAAAIRIAVVLWGLLAWHSQAGTVWPVLIQDSLGREVRVPALPRRIVSLAPSNTEILFALGAGEKVAGVTTFCDFPEEARSRAKVGGFAAATINLETLVALSPDLVLAGDDAQRGVVEALEHLGIPAISIKARDFAAIYESILLVGKLTGRETAAESLTAGMRRRVAAVSQRAAQLEPVEKRRVYWEVFDAPVMTAGRLSIVGQLIELAGGVNVFADVPEEFPQVSTEAVVVRDPEVIFAPDMAKGGALTVAKLRRRPGWAGITAVRKGRVHVVSADLTSRPGPRLVEGLEQVADALYPRFNDREAR